MRNHLAFSALMMLLTTAPLAAQEVPERGSFVNRRGDDTLTVERFARSAGRLEAELEGRVPSPGVRYAATLAPDGLIPSMEFAVAGAAGDEPVASGTVVFRGDSATARVQAPGAPPEQHFAPGAGAMPYINLSVALMEQLVRRARSVGGERVAIPMLNLMGGNTFTLVVESQALDFAILRLPPAVDIHLRVDAVGRVLGGSVPSQGITIERSARPDLRLGPAPAPDYSAPAGAPYAAEEVRVPAPAGHTLAGTLTLPRERRGPVPAVLLLSGSGPQDRDESLPGVAGYRPFRQIAGALGRRGIAVLRLDDRGVGDSGGTFNTSGLRDFAADAAAAVAWLRERPEIDGGRVALVGHSEGGIVGPLVAATDPRLRALAVLAAPGLPGREIVNYQQRYTIDQNSGLPAAERDSAYAAATAQVDSIAADVVWLRDLLAYDPLPTARQLRLPVLVLQGATDRQVTAEQAETFGAAVRQGGNRDVTVRVFPGLNHLFLADPSGNPAGYAALPDKRLPPVVLDTLADWLVARLR